ncbi:VanZ family protein [Streptomyces sp. NPDC058855]|uniref:VanZ family protein n=1 Tax=Streptomyces sp. NPDC058855 TaxID=3346651 RepID=UPI0036D06444
MIKAVFQHHLTFLAIAIAVTVAVGVAVFLLTRRRTGSHAVLNGLWAASAVGPAILTSWSGSGVLTYECAVNTDVVQALQSTQGQLNLVLFIPYGLFAALATRRPLFAAATGLLFTAAIETAQATVPFISRLCDTDDLITNGLGACLGAALGALISRRLPGGGVRAQPSTRRALAWSAPAIVLIAVGWLTVIDPVRVHPPAATAPSATAAQSAAINDAVTEAFPSAFQPNNVFYADNGDGTASVTASLPGGFAELSWPDREQFTAHFTPASNGEGTHSYRIPGLSHPISTADEAKQIALAYADRYAPWAKSGAQITVRAIDENVSVGWIVEWRRWKNDVLMPMRLSIAIEPSGGLIDLIARNVADPHLPPAKISEAKAWEIFDQQHKLRPGQKQREQPIHLAQRRNGQWRIHWLLSVRDGNTLHSATVDATDGSTHNKTTIPVQDGNSPQ